MIPIIIFYSWVNQRLFVISHSQWWTVNKGGNRRPMSLCKILRSYNKQHEFVLSPLIIQLLTSIFCLSHALLWLQKEQWWYVLLQVSKFLSKFGAMAFGKNYLPGYLEFAMWSPILQMFSGLLCPIKMDHHAYVPNCIIGTLKNRDLNMTISLTSG